MLARSLAEELPAALEEKNLFENFVQPIIIPIPATKKRERMRGFNQAKVLAEALHELLDKNEYFFDAKTLVRVRETVSQTKMASRRARLANPRGSFAVLAPEKVSGRNIILVDDVSTTGATLSEAAKTLKRAGARDVFALTLAH